MLCSIPGTNIKVLNKTIDALSKLSDEVYIVCQESSLVFTAYNVLKTAYAKYIFDANYFIHYECEKEPNESMACKISNRSLMMIFKRKMERKLESCKINLIQDDDHITFHLRYKSGVNTIHTLHLLDWEHSSWDCERDENSNKVICKSALLLNVLSNFKRKDAQLYVDANKDNIILRNYGEDQNNMKTVHSQIKLQRAEFHSYDVHSPCKFMMSVRALRSVISFADSMGLLMMVSFTTGGQPLLISVEQESCHGYCAISTVSLDGSQSVASLPIARNSTTVSIPRSVATDSEMEVDSVEETASNPSAQCEEYNHAADLDSDSFDLTCVNDDVFKEPQNPNIMHIFGRCYDATFRQSQLSFGKVLCENSDSE